MGSLAWSPQEKSWPFSVHQGAGNQLSSMHLQGDFKDRAFQEQY
uniref:Uncharacterized protein n=1 Tax=Rhizophora mucronata TaxID=61149 RepID=A0A2P2NEC1_RHIMU